MRAWQAIVRFMSVAALLATALAFVAPDAEAHSGHSHHEGHAAVQLEKADAAVDASAVASDALYRSGDRSADKYHCLGGCCSASMACCAAPPPAALSLGTPDWRSIRRVPVAIEGVGIEPGVPLKPPRSAAI